MSDRSRPLVGILANTELIDGVAHQAVRSVYLRAVNEFARCEAVVLPAGGSAVAGVERLDGVLLTGHQSDVGDDPARDAAALAAIPFAVERGIPLLGLCRGLQEMNVAYGGTLRSVPGHREDLSLPRDQQYLPRHPVSIINPGALHTIVRSTKVWVNSLHSQAIDVLARELRVEAAAPDGVIEAVSVAGATALALGVQWHPEWHAATDPVCRDIFAAFGAACRDGATRHGRVA